MNKHGITYEALFHVLCVYLWYVRRIVLKIVFFLFEPTVFHKIKNVLNGNGNIFFFVLLWNNSKLWFWRVNSYVNNMCMRVLVYDLTMHEHYCFNSLYSFNVLRVNEVIGECRRRRMNKLTMYRNISLFL